MKHLPSLTFELQTPLALGIKPELFVCEDHVKYRSSLKVELDP